MATTYTLIQTYTFTSASAGYAFTSIPGTYTDLKLIASARADGSNEYWDFGLEFNSDATSANYVSWSGNTGPTPNGQLYDGSYPYIYALNSIAGDTAGTNMFGIVEIDIPNYSNTGRNKAVSFNMTSIRATSTRVYNGIGGGYWKSNSAITRVYVSAPGANLKIGTVLSLYGIKNS